MLHLFEDICDIAGLRLRAEAGAPTPSTAVETARDRTGARRDVRGYAAQPRGAAALGMTTVLVHSDYIDHPAQLKISEWRELPAHIHYLTRDLTGFLKTEIDFSKPPANV